MATEPIHILLETLIAQVRWSVIELLPGLALWLSLRRFLPSVLAWGLARILGGYFAVWLALLPILKLGKVPFTQNTYTFAIAVVAIVGLLVTRVVKKTFVSKGPSTLQGILEFEGATAFVRLLLLLINAGGNALQVSDRMRDASFLTAIMTQLSYPVQDLWYAGHVVPYYLFSYYPLAGTALQAGETPLAAYPLALNTVAAQYFSALYLLFRGQSFRFFPALMGGLTLVWGADLKIFISFLRKIFTGTPEVGHAVGDHTLVQLPFDFFLGGYVHPCFNTMGLLVVLLLITQFYWKQQGNTPPATADRLYVISAGWLVATIWGANSWEVPIFLGVGVVALSLRFGWERRRPAIVHIIALVFVSYFFSSPFRAVSYPSSFAFERMSDPIQPVEWLSTFGLFLIPIALALAFTYLKPVKPIDVVLATLCLFSLFLPNAAYFTCGLLLLSVRAYQKHRHLSFSHDLLFLVGGMAIILGYHVFCLKEDRFNSIIKFTLPAWTLVGIAAVLSLHHLKTAFSRRTWITLAALVLIPANFWGFRSLRSFAILFHDIQPRDGLSLIAAQFPDDAKVLRWARDHVRDPQSRILESPGSVYTRYHTRFATVTGLPCLVCSAGSLHHRYYEKSEAQRRFELVQEVYSGAFGSDCENFKNRLRKESVKYVVLGELERLDYPQSEWSPLRQCLTSQYEAGNSVLLRVD